VLVNRVCFFCGSGLDRTGQDGAAGWNRLAEAKFEGSVCCRERDMRVGWSTERSTIGSGIYESGMVGEDQFKMFNRKETT
jgi:hypothetical protein